MFTKIASIDARFQKPDRYLHPMCEYSSIYISKYLSTAIVTFATVRYPPRHSKKGSGRNTSVRVNYVHHHPPPELFTFDNSTLHFYILRGIAKYLLLLMKTFHAIICSTTSPAASPKYMIILYKSTHI